MDSPITIRRAAAGDEEILAAIGAASFLENFVDLIPGADLIKHLRTQHCAEAYLKYLTGDDPRYACWLVELSSTGSPIGYAVTVPPELPIDTHATDIELKRIYVLSRYHGNGAAKVLQTAADNHASDLNCTRLLLGTHHDNQRAISFYRREGYETVGTRQFQVGDQLFDDIIMAKPLSA